MGGQKAPSRVVAVDLDGTLAWRPHKVDGIPFIGAPIPAMKKRVMGWLSEGHEVVIFTARAANPKNIPAVLAWLKKYGFPALEVTNEKLPKFSEIWDDRAIGVEFNTGEKVAMVKEAGEAGCLMAKFGDSDARKVLEFEDERIPEDQLAGDGYERDVHVTCLYGFPKDFDHENMWNKFFTEQRRKPIHVKLGKIIRFKASENRPESDVLVVEVDSPELSALHYDLRKRYSSINCTYPDFKPHMTLAYLKPGACKELDGHDYFKGRAYLLSTLTYSTPGRAEKAYYELK